MSGRLAGVVWFVCLLFPVTVQAQSLRLAYADFFPSTHAQSLLAKAWCEEVEKRTRGDIVIDYYPGGTLARAPQIYDAVTSGIADIGMSALAYSRGRFPVMEAVDLPLGYADAAEATAAANRVYSAFEPSSFADVHVLYFHGHGPGVLHTAKTPITRLEDFKGKKIRATGNSAKLVKALGATPVALSMPDSYQALQKGAVSGSMYPVETNEGWKMAEVVDYQTIARPIGYTTTMFVVISRDRWEAIPAQQQAIISQISADWSGKHAQAWDLSDEKGKEAFLQAGGEVVTLTAQESTRWKEAADVVVQEYVSKRAGKKPSGQEILQVLQQ